MPVVYFHLLEAAGSQCIIKIYILTPVKAALLLLYVLILLFYFVENIWNRFEKLKNKADIYDYASNFTDIIESLIITIYSLNN